MREVRVWIPKRRAHEARVSEALPHRRDVQQCKVRVSSQRYETRVSTPEHGTREVRVSQMSLDKHDNQQREVRISYKQRYETRISKLKRENRVCSTECELL